MAINLKAIQPHKVSRDLTGYMTYIYGRGGVGKTTFGVQAPKALLLAFERGYDTLPGCLPQDVNSWGEMRQVMRDLKDPEVKKMYTTVVIDTVDIASKLCEKYVCNQLDIENIGDGGWTKNGWSKVKAEWEEVFRTISMEGYALIFISHDKEKIFTRKDGTTYNQICPSCSTAYNEIIKNMVDIEGYIDSSERGERKLVLRSYDDTIECKCRFKEIAPVIPFGYEHLAKALNEAIDKEAAGTGNKFITDEKAVIEKAPEYDYAVLIEEFQTLANQMMEKNPQVNGPKIVSIVDKYLGKGHKVADATPDQAELLYLINCDIQDMMAK